MTTVRGTRTAPDHGVFARLAAWSQRHRWGAVLLWLLVVAAITAGSRAAGTTYHNDFSLPGTDSQRATELLERHGSAQAGDSVQIVFQDEHRLTGQRDRIGTMLDRVHGLPGVADVRSPYADCAAISGDGTIGYATVTLDGRAQDVPKADVRAVIDTAQAAATDELRVELGGDAARGAEERAGCAAEGAGILAALVILVLLFGSVVAAALPLLTAVFAVGGAVGLIALASQVFTIADFTRR